MAQWAAEIHLDRGLRTPRQEGYYHAPTCQGCSAPLKRKSNRGPDPLYCSEACRKRYRRDNKIWLAEGREVPRRLARVYEGDGFEWLRCFRDDTVDCILTDPAYSSGAVDSFDQIDKGEWVFWFKEFHRVLRSGRAAFIWCSEQMREAFVAAARKAKFNVHTPAIWGKVEAKAPLRTRRASVWQESEYEYILRCTKGLVPGDALRGDLLKKDTTSWGFDRPRLYLEPVPRISDPRVSTPKPVGVLKALIEMSTVPLDLVIDPFAGSGNTAIAARAIGRRAWVCDLPSHADIAAQRLGGLKRRAVADYDYAANPLPEGAV